MGEELPELDGRVWAQYPHAEPRLGAEGVG